MNARITLLALAGGALVSQAALGQTSDRPWYVGLTQDFSRDSNALGTTSGEISDTVSTTTLRGGINQTFGRQRLRADLSLNHQRHSELSERDSNGYTAGLILDWS